MGNGNSMVKVVMGVSFSADVKKSNNYEMNAGHLWNKFYVLINCCFF